MNEAQPTPLIHSITRRRGDVIALLIDNPNCIAERDAQGRTPLMEAVRIGNVKLVADLVSAGADLDAVEKHGRTALHVAQVSSLGKAFTTKSLLVSGAKADIADKNGQTPLGLALACWSLGSARVLLRHGAQLQPSDLPHLQGIVERLRKTGERNAELCAAIEGQILVLNSPARSRREPRQSEIEPGL